MKKYLILMILIIFLSGCNYCNLGWFVLPDDAEFIKTVENLDTLEKICEYMQDNFTNVKYKYIAYTPYKMWKIKKGDCNDYSTFAVFCAEYNGWKTWQIYINFGDHAHMMGVYDGGDYYYVTDLDCLYPNVYENFKDIADIYNNWKYYKIYDYGMNLIEFGENKGDD